MEITAVEGFSEVWANNLRHAIAETDGRSAILALAWDWYERQAQIPEDRRQELDRRELLRMA